MKVEWTPERVEELRALNARGLSLEAMGKHFGISRSAIAGARWRHLENGGRRGPIKREAKVAKKRDQRTWTDAKMAELREYIEDGLKLWQIADKFGKRPEDITRQARKMGLEPSHVRRPVAPPSGNRLTILELHAEACRYPFTQANGSTLYCGDRIARNSYCAHHANVCYIPIRRANKWER